MPESKFTRVEQLWDNFEGIITESENLQERVERECWPNIPLAMAAPLFELVQQKRELDNE